MNLTPPPPRPPTGEADAAIHFIGGGQAGTPAAGAERVGQKAYNLIRMAALGLPVPPAFALDTSLCRAFFAAGERLPPSGNDLLAAGIHWLEGVTGATFGGARRPLLVSVRSGATVSMPGMMDTVLDIGLNDATVQSLIRATGNPRLAWDSYRRLIQSYAEIVRGCPPEPFARIIERFVGAGSWSGPEEFDTETLKALAEEFLELVRPLTGAAFPQDPRAQLAEAAAAVFRSWNSPRAVEYRRLYRLSEEAGTAVTVQTMVFGNGGGTSGAGVGFTRNPATGADELYVDYLPGTQGEDVVSGRFAVRDARHLALVLPKVHAELNRIKPVLEREFKDIQDFEFTVQEGRLYMLQTRSGKRTPWAAVQIAVDLVNQGMIEPAMALERLAEIDLDSVARIRLDASGEPIARGTPASTGVAVGRAAFDSRQARTMAEKGEVAILIRGGTAAEDIEGIAAADGILTARGCRTSHAAVVARQLGKVCVVGCGGLRIGEDGQECTIGGRPFAPGDPLSIDGDSGAVFAGQVAVRRERPDAALAKISEWRNNAAPAAPLPRPAGRSAASSLSAAP
ncbi:MAG: pyruvate, phosphate dikinase [Rhodospirillales bacterium]|nr:pyruvate, phosphate dikinase [Rhodospirillales bacterium]